MGTKAAWTPERRANQTQIIRRVEPWKRSTGPRTAAGKSRSSKNATAFLRDPKACLSKQFLKTGNFPPRLDELCRESEMNPDLGDPGEAPSSDSDCPDDAFEYPLAECRLRPRPTR